MDGAVRTAIFALVSLPSENVKKQTNPSQISPSHSKVLEVLRIMFNVVFEEDVVHSTTPPWKFGSKFCTAGSTQLFGVTACMFVDNLELSVTFFNDEEFRSRRIQNTFEERHDFSSSSGLPVQNFDMRFHQLEQRCLESEQIVSSLRDEIKEYQTGTLWYQQRVKMLETAVTHIGQHIKISGTQRTVLEDTLMRTTVVLVQGAGTAAVNGRYTFSRLLEGINADNPYYTRRWVYRDQEVTFGIFKSRVRSSSASHQWFLSAIPDSTQPGSPTDIDFYYAFAPEGATFTLPPSEWRPFPSTDTNRLPHGFDPAPSVGREHQRELQVISGRSTSATLSSGISLEAILAAAGCPIGDRGVPTGIAAGAGLAATADHVAIFAALSTPPGGELASQRSEASATSSRGASAASLGSSASSASSRATSASPRGFSTEDEDI